jgi:GNAT acetyltransferase-like protein
MALPKQVVYRYFSEDDLSELVSFLGEYLWDDAGGELEGLFRWKHLRNPFGKSEMALAVDDGGKIVAFLAGVQWKLMVGGRVINCMRWTDVVSHPDTRRQGNGAFAPVVLATKLTEKARLQGISLFFSSGANKYSLAFATNFGWSDVQRLWPLVKGDYRRVLGSAVKLKLHRQRTSGYVAKDFFKHEPTPVTALLDHPGIDSLLRKDAQLEDSKLLTTCRSREYLKWRYGEHPTINYYALMRERAGELSAAAIFRTGKNLDFKVIVIDEIFLASPEEAIGLLDELYRSVGADLLSTRVCLGSWKLNILRKSGFRNTQHYYSYSRHFVDHFPDRLVSYNLDRTIPADPSLAENWALSNGELEEF